MSVHSHMRPYRRQRTEEITANWVFSHHGNHHDFFQRYLRLVREAHKCKKRLQAIASLAERALYLIHDTRTLRTAWDHLYTYGGHAPGLDGLTYSDFGDKDVWKICQQYRWLIRCGRYRTRSEKVVEISKGLGRGSRPLVIMSILDRMVQRAAVEILQPVLDPLFLDDSCGYRPGRGREDALARAWRYYLDDNPVWIAVDIRDAFLNVPVDRVLQIVGRYLPADDLIDFLRRCLANPSTKGLRQGGPLSPLMLNLYLHHHLDRHWAKRYPDPMIRVADDILILCGSRQRAEMLYGDLSERLRKIGLKLKESENEAIHDLSRGEAVDWIGYRIEGRESGLEVDISERAWEGLEELMVLAGRETDRWFRGNDVLREWISQQGACYTPDRLPIDRYWMACMAEENGVGYPLEVVTVEHFWQRAHARWRKKLKSVLTTCSERV